MAANKIRIERDALYEWAGGYYQFVESLGGRKCHYCATPTLIEHEARSEGFTDDRWWKHRARNFDHIVPKVRGGSDDDWNMVVACAYCNQRKHDRIYENHCVRCSTAVHLQRTVICFPGI
jgi:5-methylcytosine-specific restriction endonuclease McrA